MIDIKKHLEEKEIREKIQALDVKDKIVFVTVPGDKLKDYYGDRAWETCRKNGAISVIFIPSHMNVTMFNDKDLKSIGLMRIPPETNDAA